jgi:hypothetical protein
MPTKREREYYRMGFADGRSAGSGIVDRFGQIEPALDLSYEGEVSKRQSRFLATKGKKRKLSAWNKYVKANSKKPRFRYRNGKLNLKKMAIAFRKTPAGKKKRR